MAKVPQHESTVQYTERLRQALQRDTALRQAAAQARTRYAGEAARIDRALVIALNGGVTLHEGGTASVQSCSDTEVVYAVADGVCDCPDFPRAPAGRCKHRFAVCLVQEAGGGAGSRKQEAGSPDPDSCSLLLASRFSPSQQAEAYYTTTTASQGLVLGGHRATADAKRAEEEAAGGLAALVCGYGGRAAVGPAAQSHEGTQVVPLDNESAGYREWLVSIGGDDYCIVEDAGTWTLMQFQSDRRQRWEDVPQTVEAFLSAHSLILAG
jgi:hypothetical protein